MEEKLDEDNHNNSIIISVKAQISSNLFIDPLISSKEYKISARISPYMMGIVTKK